MPRFEDLAAEGQALVEVGGAVVGVDVATQAELDAVDAAKAPLASPALTGTPTVPTAPAGTNTTQAASTAFVKGAVDNATSATPLPSTFWVGPSVIVSPSASSLPLDRLHLMPNFFASATLDAMRVEVTTAGGVGSVLRLGIYGDSLGRPGSLILDAGTVSAETTGEKTVTISQAVSGRVWLGVVAQGSATVPNVRCNGAAVGVPSNLTSQAFQGQGKELYASGISGALPASPSLASGHGNRGPIIFVRAT